MLNGSAKSGHRSMRYRIFWGDSRLRTLFHPLSISIEQERDVWRNWIMVVSV